jgi:hypothetical protein
MANNSGGEISLPYQKGDTLVSSGIKYKVTGVTKNETELLDSELNSTTVKTEYILNNILKSRMFVEKRDRARARRETNWQIHLDNFYEREKEMGKDKMADGGMMAKGGKPKVIYTQFEEEEFEYADGGGVADKVRLKEIDRQIKEQLKTIKEFEEDDTEREYDRFGNPAPLSWNQQVVMAAEENLEKLQEERRMILKGKMADGGMMMAKGGKVPYTDKNIIAEFKDGDITFYFKDGKLFEFNHSLSEKLLSTNTISKRDLNFYGYELGSFESKKDAYDWLKNESSLEGYQDKMKWRDMMSDGGMMMAHGGKTHKSRHRKKTLEEKAMEAVGSATWFQLDKETQAGVIAELITEGILPQRMAKGAKVANDFTVTYELMDGKKVVEKYGSEEEMDAGLANFYLMNDVKDAIVGSVEEVKEVKASPAAEKPKKKGLFDTEKAVAKVAKSKETSQVVHIPGLEKEFVKFDELKAQIKNAEAEQEIIRGYIKDIAEEKYLDIYEKDRKRPTSIILESGGTEIRYTVTDKYKTMTPEKETVLQQYDNLLGTEYTFKFDNDILDKEGNNGEKIADIVNDLIANSEDIPDDLKAKLVVITKKTTVKKGTIARLLDYDNPSEILQIIEPTITLT